MGTDLPAWVAEYPASRQLDDDRWLIVKLLIGDRGRVGVATWDGWSGDFY